MIVVFRGLLLIVFVCFIYYICDFGIFELEMIKELEVIFNFLRSLNEIDYSIR